MKSFRDLPIQRKMLMMTLVICGTVLVVALAALFIFQILTFRSSFQRDTATLAAILANNSTAAMAFDDRKAAREILASLKAKPNVLFACLINSNDKVIAQFGSENDTEDIALFPNEREFRYLGGHLLYTEPVLLEGQRIGRLCMRADYRSVFVQLLGFYGLIMLGVLVVSVSLAVFLSGRLRRVITDPVLSLVETARLVAENNDYSVRSTVSGRGDELGLLANALNRMLSRIQTQDAALTLSQQKLESLINSIDGIVWEWDTVTRAFTYVSRQAERLMGYPSEQWLGSPAFWHTVLYPEDATAAIRVSDEALLSGQPYQCEYRILTADRRILWIRESAVVLDENGRKSLRGIFQDITAQKKAAEDLSELNRRLVDASRQAGMAEVATGVLHNVGNVLNSVNVSVTLLRDQVRKSETVTLARATSLLEKHHSDLATYLASDPKGKLVPQLITQVAGQLQKEQQITCRELDQLGKNVEHIKDIVAMQQSYARVAGVTEKVAIISLVEDALQINGTGLARMNTQILRRFSEVPPLMLDKHKVLQILINLIRNAKYALEESPTPQKRLEVAISSAGRESVRVAIRDNGVGIAPENLTRIFSHGFTTRKDGHGFGLHFGALNAKEMGGALTASSLGAGQGATFTLELPINHKNL